MLSHWRRLPCASLSSSARRQPASAQGAPQRKSLTAIAPLPLILLVDWQLLPAGLPIIGNLSSSSTFSSKRRSSQAQTNPNCSSPQKRRLSLHTLAQQLGPTSLTPFLWALAHPARATQRLSIPEPVILAAGILSRMRPEERLQKR